MQSKIKHTVIFIKMDLEKLKKLNQLTKELQKHSFAFNSDEAFKQAGKVFEETQQELNHMIKDESENKISVPVSSEQTKNDQQSDFLIQKKVEIMLEMNNKKFIEEIQNLKQEISNLHLQVQNLKSELQNNVNREINTEHTASPAVKQTVQNEVVQQQEPPRVQETVQEKPKDPHPRQGNYTPEDVSIEKMFYYGNKNS